MTENASAKGNNGASSGINLNWPTILMIVLTGGGNLLLTEHGNVQIRSNSEDVERALRQISELHRSLDEFEDRQKETLEGIRASLRNQNQLLAGQNKVMEADTRILEQLHRFTQNHGNPEYHQ